MHHHLEALLARVQRCLERDLKILRTLEAQRPIDQLAFLERPAEHLESCRRRVKAWRELVVEIGARIDGEVSEVGHG